MTRINEGLRARDLEDLVLPLLSIDQYESKINDDALVVGFYVNDQDPAKDLNRFIQKSAIILLDTDVSPAPNKDGYFMVFIEFMRDEKFPDKLVELCKNLEDLTGVKHWSFKAHHKSGVHPLTSANVKKLVRLDNRTVKNENMSEFFRYSFLDGVMLENNTITLRSGLWKQTFQLVDFGDVQTVSERNNLDGKPIDLAESQLFYAKQLTRNIGWEWVIQSIGGDMILNHPTSEKVMLLRPM